MHFVLICSLPDDGIIGLRSLLVSLVDDNSVNTALCLSTNFGIDFGSYSALSFSQLARSMFACRTESDARLENMVLASST